MSTQTSERQKKTLNSRPRFYLFQGNMATYERMTPVHSLQSAACHCACGSFCAIQSRSRSVDWATSAISSLFAAGRSIRRFPSLWLDHLFRISDISRRRRCIVIMWWTDIATEGAQSKIEWSRTCIRDRSIHDLVTLKSNHRLEVRCWISSPIDKFQR